MPSELPQLIPVFPGGTPLLPPVVGGTIPVSSPLPPASFGLVMDPSKKLAASVLDALDPPGSTLDSLDLLPYSDTRLDALDSFGSTRGSLDKPNSFVGEAWVDTFTPTPLTVFRMPSHLQSLGSGVGITVQFSQSPGPLSPSWSRATASELPCLPQCSAQGGAEARGAGCLVQDQTAELELTVWCSPPSLLGPWGRQAGRIPWE